MNRPAKSLATRIAAAIAVTLAAATVMFLATNSSDTLPVLDITIPETVGTVPDLVGKLAPDAAATASELGVTLDHWGTGARIVSQHPPAGTAMPANGTLTIRLGDESPGPTGDTPIDTLNPDGSLPERVNPNGITDEVRSPQDQAGTPPSVNFDTGSDLWYQLHTTLVFDTTAPAYEDHETIQFLVTDSAGRWIGAAAYPSERTCKAGARTPVTFMLPGPVRSAETFTVRPHLLIDDQWVAAGRPAELSAADHQAGKVLVVTAAGTVNDATAAAVTLSEDPGICT